MPPEEAKIVFWLCRRPPFLYTFARMSDCLFCKIISGEIPSKKLYEDDEFLAFLDTAPQAPTHFLVVPKKHIPTLMDMAPEDSLTVGKMLYCAQQVAKGQGLEKPGARFIFNCKEDAGQTVFHLHLHVLGGRKFGWPPYPPDAAE